MNEFVGWAISNPRDAVAFLAFIVAFFVIPLALMAYWTYGLIERRRTAQPEEEDEGPLEAIAEAKEVVEKWLDGVDEVDVNDALAATARLVRLLGEAIGPVPGASEAHLLAIRAEGNLSEARGALTVLFEATDRVLEAAEEERPWSDRRERVGFGARGG